MKIVCDLDDTLFNFNSAINQFLKRKYNIQLKKETYTTFELAKVWNCDQSDAIEMILEFYKSTEFENMKLISGAKEFLKNHNTSEFIFMTSRPEHARDVTEKQIKRISKLCDLRDPILYLSAWNNPDKPELCSRIKPDIFVDDSMNNIIGCKGIVPHMFIPKQPWNTELKGCIRGNILEINNHLSKLKVQKKK